MAAAVARVRRTFIEYPVQPEFMDLSFMDEEDEDSLNLRTQSDPTGENAEFAQPRKVLVPMRGVAEEASKEAKASAAGGASGSILPTDEAEEQDEEDEEEEEEEDQDDEDDDEDEEAGSHLFRTESVIHSPPGVGCSASGFSLPQIPEKDYPEAQLGWGQVGPVPWTPYLAYDMAQAVPQPCMWPCGPQDAMSPPLVDSAMECPPFGELHTFHRETLQFCTLDQSLRMFTKGKHFHGRLSVVTEGKVRKGGCQRYMVQLVGGSLSRADGIGFVFAQRLPCTKDMQKIVSVYLNQQGEIGMRLFSKTEKANESVSPLETGDWIEMDIDLDRHAVRFGVWRWNACTWPGALQLVSSAHWDYSGKLAEAENAKDMSVGYLACVVKNSGACMRLGS